MNERLLCALRERRALLHQGWVSRLRAAPCSTPLAHPDVLMHLMNRTLDEVFHDLSSRPLARRRQPPLPRGLCICGRNPLLAYFSTAALAFQHTLAMCADDMPVTPYDADQVERALARVARREITVFCALCRKKEAPAEPCPPERISIAAPDPAPATPDGHEH